MKRVQSYGAPGITVTFDPNRCIHSAVSQRALPAVFDVGRKRWVRPEAAGAAEVAAAIERCPSGALRYVLAGEAEPAVEESGGQTGTSIQASLDGPLLVEGSFTLLDENGERIASAGRAALCRCGGTATPPFCDSSHRHNGFRSRRGPTGGGR